VRWRGPAVPRVALTFDDGPDPASTPLLLETLERLGVPATFFCLGHAVDLHPDVVAAVAARGHEVGTHGYDHISHLTRGPSWVARDLAAGVGALEALGIRARWFRPPYGHLTGSTMAAARRLGLETAMWSVWGAEWRDADPAGVAGAVTRGLDPGAIVLLHDTDRHGRPGMWRTALDALDGIVTGARSRGYELVRMSDLVV
jgi:peptidoglycan-N-acetylglucosamine deacetylase